MLEAPFSKMLASSTSEYLYASRSTLLYKINIDNCHLYTTCQECVDTEDPVCGYCSLTETCTRKLVYLCQPLLLINDMDAAGVQGIRKNPFSFSLSIEIHLTNFHIPGQPRVLINLHGILKYV